MSTSPISAYDELQVGLGQILLKLTKQILRIIIKIAFKSNIIHSNLEKNSFVL
ncbi:MAG: hypothetical protein ACFFDC_10055 [Promethearchaeota archaeon]